MTANVAAARRVVEDNSPAGLGGQRQRAFAGRVVEAPENQAIKGETNLPLGTFHPEWTVGFLLQRVLCCSFAPLSGRNFVEKNPDGPFQSKSAHRDLA